MLVKYGSYTGSGADNNAITGVGFQPKYVLIRRGDSTEAGTCHKTNTFTTTNSMTIPDSGAVNGATGIKSLDADGFTLGTLANVNASTVTYYYLAFGGSVSFATGSYTGDGSTKNITGLGFDPQFVLVFRTDTAAFPAQRFGTYNDANSQHLVSSTPVSGEISAFVTDGFTVNNAARVNASGGAYHYVAWRDVTGVCKQSSYVGNATDNRSITGVGFQPDALFICRDQAGNSTRWRTASVAGDSSWFMPQYAATTNEIQALEADGFQVGSGTATNPAASEEVHYIAWKSSASEGSASPARRRMMSGIGS
jgi:hypothetical protein